MPDEDEVTEPESSDKYAQVLELLGFDPTQVKTVILTPDSAVAVAHDYPEPNGGSEDA